MKAKDIDSLDDFKRRTKKVIAELKKTGRPRILTVNGKAALVVQDAGAYFEDQELAEAQEERDTLAAIELGLAQIERGEVDTAENVFARLWAQHAEMQAKAAGAAPKKRRAAKAS